MNIVTIEELFEFVIKKTEEYKNKKISSDESFNIFQILDISHREVDLHSKFIAELLNPKGRHEKGSIFLKKFLEVCELKIEGFDFNSAYVDIEYTIPKGFEDSSGRIDIYIEIPSEQLETENSKFYKIAIENKIYAVDQENQLERYYNFISKKSQGFKVFYLTLDGKSANDYTRGSLNENDIKKISYEAHISKWLELCSKEATFNPVLRETIKQYIITIKNLIGKTIRSSVAMEIRDLIKKEYDKIDFSLLQEGIEATKVEVLFQFWKKMEERLIENTNNYSIILDESFVRKYTEENIKNYFQNPRPYYVGICIKIEGYNSLKVMLATETSSSNGGDFFYWFYFDGLNLNEKENKLIEILKTNRDFKSNGNKTIPNFYRYVNDYNFKDANRSFQLLKEENMNAFSKKIIDEIKNLLA